MKKIHRRRNVKEGYLCIYSEGNKRRGIYMRKKFVERANPR